MPTVAIPDIVSHSTDLRAELKEWERTFAAANGGRKADRGDIKKVPEIGMPLNSTDASLIAPMVNVSFIQLPSTNSTPVSSPWKQPPTPTNNPTNQPNAKTLPRNENMHPRLDQKKMLPYQLRAKPTEVAHLPPPPRPDSTPPTPPRSTPTTRPRPCADYSAPPPTCNPHR